MRIEKFSPPELDNAEYRHLVKDIFGEDDPKHVPAFVYFGYHQNDLIGFASFYFHDALTIYIQRIGVLPVHRARPYTARLWKAFISQIRETEKARYVMGAIAQGNIGAQIAALKAGFLVHGMRVTTIGEILIEVILDLKEKNSG